MRAWLSLNVAIVQNAEQHIGCGYSNRAGLPELARYSWAMGGGSYWLCLCAEDDMAEPGHADAAGDELAEVEAPTKRARVLLDDSDED